MTETSLLNLPYIAPSQAQKHVTHNEALRMLDALVQLSSSSASVAIPPLSPFEGQRFIIPDGAAGDWAGKTGSVAAWQDGGWAFYLPQPGWRCFVEDTGALMMFSGGAWTGLESPLPGSMPQLGINVTADSVNRLAVAANATLFSHDGAGHQLKINRGAPAETASLVFQDNYSGRAECGIIGGNDWRLKISSDGAIWQDAMVVDNTDGSVSFPSGIKPDAGDFTLSLGVTATGAYAGATGLTQLYARYTLIGDLCFCRCAFQLTGLSSMDLQVGSALHLRGLPFAAANLAGSVDQFAAGSVYRSIGSGQNTLLGGYCSNPDNLYLFSFALSGNNARNTDAHFVSFHYQIE